MYAEKVNDKFLFDLGSVLGRRLSEVQRESVRVILQTIDDFGIKDPNKVAYILGTVWHESRFSPIKEIRAKPGTQIYRLQNRYWASGYYGRGFVQITWRKNYAKFSAILGVDLVGNPDLALEPQTAAKILVQGMAQGLFTGVGLDRFFVEGVPPRWIEARKIVNGLFQAGHVATAARKILPVIFGTDSGTA